MTYPEDLSRQARARIVHAKVKARQVYLDSLSDPSAFPLGIMTRYIMTVFAAFAKEACSLASSGVWGVDRVEIEASKWIYSTVLFAEEDVGIQGERFRSFLTESGMGIKSEILATLKQEPQWRHYEQDLLGVSEMQADDTPLALSEPQRATNRPVGLLRMMMEEEVREMARIRVRQREQPQASGDSPLPTTKTAKASKRNRLSKTIKSDIAARRLEAFLDASPMEKTVFARNAGTTERTLLRFRRTGRINRQTLREISREMGTTLEELTKP
jgi:hypothetical protein